MKERKGAFSHFRNSSRKGNLLASNGNILACNLKVYDIKLDLRHNKVKSQNPIPWAKIDSLADSLDYHYPRVRNLNQHPDTFKKYSWHTRLKKEFEKDPDKRPRALRVAQKKDPRRLREDSQLPLSQRLSRKRIQNPGV